MILHIRFISVVLASLFMDVLGAENINLNKNIEIAKTDDLKIKTDQVDSSTLVTEEKKVVAIVEKPVIAPDTAKEKVIKKLPFIFDGGAGELKTWVKIRIPEFFYGKNLSLINNDNPTDRVLYFRHVFDINFEYRYFGPQRDYDIIFVKTDIRNKGVWGDPESIAFTTMSEVKVLDSLLGPHRHGIPRYILWIRELWIQLAYSDLLCLPFCRNHTITFGAFPFELGRGIALGASYAVDASDLGFYNETAVDQYAFGGKLSGEIRKGLDYDLYAAILSDKAASFTTTNDKIRGQQFNHRNDQARGFGSITYVVAARLKCDPVIKLPAKVHFEPYGLYYNNPEQKIEFLADSTSELATFGIAGEFEFRNIEFGFDTAFNFGHQTVHGWDSNVIRLENRNGTVVEVNSKVRQAPPGQVPSATSSPLALKVSANQKIINNSLESASQNGKVIGVDNLGTLINDIERFNDPYINKYRGSMLVCDGSYWIMRPDLKISAGFGYASGDNNPNRDLDHIGDSEVDGVYDGFISLQETYSGTRIKSAFLLSGSGKIPRLLSFPSEVVTDPFPSAVSRFTNLVFTGGSLNWRPCWSCKKWSVNPNILAYWQEFATRFFDRSKETFSQSRNARTYLGLEVNVFMEAELIEDLKFFFVGAIFFPGGHYDDIKGLPLNKSQQTFLDNLDVTGIVNDRVPLLGNDPAFFANAGLEYKF